MILLGEIRVIKSHASENKLNTVGSGRYILSLRNPIALDNWLREKKKATGASLLRFNASASVWLTALKGEGPKGEGQMPASLI